MFQIVLSTCPTKKFAEELAHYLVKEKLAACVNILPQITSVYLWQGTVSQDIEQQLIIKTTKDKFNELKQTIEKLHPYDVPEVIALDITSGNQTYLNWITESLK